MMVTKDVLEIWCVEVTTVESLVCTITLKTTVVMNPPLSPQRGYLLLSFQGFPWTLLQVRGVQGVTIHQAGDVALLRILVMRGRGTVMEHWMED